MLELNPPLLIVLKILTYLYASIGMANSITWVDKTIGPRIATFYAILLFLGTIFVIDIFGIFTSN